MKKVQLEKIFYEKGDIAMVVFEVGTMHPLYKKTIKAVCTGLNSKYGYAEWETIDEIYWPKATQGLLVYKDGEFIGYKTSPEHNEKHKGWAKVIEIIECV